MATYGPMRVYGRGTPSGLVFLSGGSALNRLASLLAAAQAHATHVISVFDDGGSTGRLRDAYACIAVGDIRKRLVAIGDRGAAASGPMIDLLESRLPGQLDNTTLRAMVQAFADGTGDSLAAIPPMVATDVSQALHTLLATVPAAFDWRDCSVGNLILTGRYLRVGSWDQALAWAHDVVSACGHVVPVTTDHAHLGARLANGRYVLGQSAVTSESRPIESPIEQIAIHVAGGAQSAGRAAANPMAIQTLKEARAIVYSWGSFYTSIVCSLLVDGITAALRSGDAPKILLLNPFGDAETRGKDAYDLVRDLIGYARDHAALGSQAALTHVLALYTAGGRRRSLYDPRARTRLEAMGVEVIEMECPGVPQGREVERIMQQLLTLAQPASSARRVHASPSTSLGPAT